VIADPRESSEGRPRDLTVAKRTVSEPRESEMPQMSLNPGSRIERRPAATRSAPPVVMTAVAIPNQPPMCSES
jgi:hypothetical protein